MAVVSSELEDLQAWKAGDQEAGRQLVEQHFESVLRFFRTKSSEDADDLAQQTFLRCVEYADRFEGRSTFKAFLFGIARNVLFEYIRRRIKDRKMTPDFGVSSILDLNPGASTMASRMAEEQVLVEAMQSLPLELQITLELHYWEELSVEEVADAVEVPPGTVKSRLHRGRTLLRKQLDAVGATHTFGFA